MDKSTEATITCPKCEGEGTVRYVLEGSEKIVKMPGDEPGVWQTGTCWTCNGKCTVKAKKSPSFEWKFMQRMNGKAPTLPSFKPELFVERLNILALIWQMNHFHDEGRSFSSCWKPVDGGYRLISVLDGELSPMTRYLLDYAPVMDADALIAMSSSNVIDGAGVLCIVLNFDKLMEFKASKKPLNSLRKHFVGRLCDEGYRDRMSYERYTFEYSVDRLLIDSL